MAFDTYMAFMTPDDKLVPGESQVVVGTDALGTDATSATTKLSAGNVFEISDFSFSIEQVLNISSSTSGAGAGKVTFEPFSITRVTDRASPQLFTMCCAGQHFKYVSLFLRKAGAAATGTSVSSGATFLRFDFALVAVKSISWSGSDGDESPKEEVQFEFGALQVRYAQQNADGSLQAAKTGAWNKVQNNNKFTAIVAT